MFSKRGMIRVLSSAGACLVFGWACLPAGGIHFGPVSAVVNKVNEYNDKIRDESINRGTWNGSGGNIGHGNAHFGFYTNGVPNADFRPEWGPYVSALGHIFIHEDRWIEKFDQQGTLLLTYSVSASNVRSFCVDSKDNVFIFSSEGNSIEKYNADGRLLTRFGGFNNTGCQGQIAVDSNNMIYATDVGNHRVQKFDNNGNSVIAWSDSEIAGWHSMCIDENNYIYIARGYANDFHRYSPDGVLRDTFTISGTVDLYGAAIGTCVRSNRLYIASPNSNKVFVYLVPGSSGTMSLFDSVGGPGTNNGEFNLKQGSDFPGVFCTGTYWLVSDPGNHRVQKFDMSDNFISWLGFK